MTLHLYRMVPQNVLERILDKMAFHVWNQNLVKVFLQVCENIFREGFAKKSMSWKKTYREEREQTETEEVEEREKKTRKKKRESKQKRGERNYMTKIWSLCTDFAASLAKVCE